MKHKVNYLLIKTLAAGGAILLALILLFVFLSKSYVQITVVPRQAKVSIDDKEMKANAKGTYKRTLAPGKHLIEISLDGYVGVAQSYTFKRGLKRKININLKELPKPELIEKKGKFLSSIDDDFYFLGKNGSTLYKGSKKDGTKYDIVPITDPKLSNIKDIVWSPDEQLALFRKSDGKLSLFDLKKYDFVHQTETTWGDNIGSVSWAPDNSEIAYYYDTGDEKTLVFSDLINNAKERVLNFENFNISNPAIHWSPDSQTLAIVPHDKDKDNNKVYLFSASARTLRELTNSGDYNDAVFLSNSLLIGIKDDGSAFLIDKDKRSEKELDFKTSAENIQVLKDFAYVLSTKNSLFRIDQTGEKNGMIIGKLSDKIADLSVVLNDGKMIVYQTPDGIFELQL